MFRKILFCVAFICNSAFAESSFKAIEISNDLLLKLKVPQRCMLGDFDAISHDMMYSKSPKLLISVSGPNGKNEVTKEILSELHTFPFPTPKNEEEVVSNNEYLDKFSSNFFSQGYDIAIKSPINEKIIEIRICKDSESTNTCVDKKVQDISKILESFIKPEDNYVAPDSVYYYQPLYKGQKSYFSLDEIYEVKNFDKYINELKVIDSEYVNLGKNSLKDLAILQSSPLYREINKKEPQKSRLIISLPMYSKSKCSMESNSN